MTCHGNMSNGEEEGDGVGESDAAYHQGGPEERQGEDHHGGHEVDQVIQAEGQHQPDVSTVLADGVNSASPVEYMISLVHKDDQGQGVPYHAYGGHGEQQQTLHRILK